MQVEKFTVKAVLKKTEDMRYYSALDINRALERALRRTDLPVYFTMGYNPHVKISFYGALKLGEVGALAIKLYFTQDVSFLEIQEALQPYLPAGLKISQPSD